MRYRRTAVIGPVTAALIAVTLAIGLPAAAAARSVPPSQPARPPAAAGPGTNLIRNASATVGATSAHGWDAVTIPGWRIQAGLPTVVAYGTGRFPRAAGSWPRSRGNLFVGGAGGTATLTQDVPLHTAAAGAGTRYALSAWLGGTRTSRAGLTVRFLSATGTTVATRAIGPVGRRPHPVLARRAASGALPAGATRAELILTLGTGLSNDNGPYAPQAGFDYAAAGDLRLTLSKPVTAPPPVTPPAAKVPRYQHVFLFYFENQDYSQIVGNRKQAPYLNSLRKRGTLLSQFYAEEHPSDANYLAFAGGSTFGVPLTDPAEENPLYTVDAKNIGDLIDARHETWKTYTQSANGPCDNTVHGYYWDDDQPMMYFRDVRDRPAYCARHVVPLEQLTSDLASPASTPNFAWVSPNDCTDMEGCGIAAGDEFLKTELTAIMNSPAWRTQRSLAIVTFDEDDTDFQHPAERVPTIVLASRGVRRGYTDPTRYTHYSMLRTVESALGLGTLTANDRFAQPMNKPFSSERTVATARTAPVTARPAPAAKVAATIATATQVRATGTTAVPGSAAARQPIAWVADYGSSSVTPVNLATRTAGTAIGVGRAPRAIAATPDGKRVYVANSGGRTVTPINAGTGRAGPPIRVGAAPWALAVTPDGKTLYVANSGSGTVTPVSTATDQPGRPIRVGRDPRAIAMAPGGKTAFVLNWLSGTVTPIATATGLPGRPIRVGAFPLAFAFAPGGATLYVAGFGAGAVTPISTRTDTAGRAIPAGQAPDALAAAKNGVFAVDGDTDQLTRLGAGTTTRVGYSPAAIAISGGTAWVVNTISGTVTPVSTRTGKAARALSVGLYSYPTAITISGSTALVLDTYGYQLSLISTRTGHVYPRIDVGAYPAAVAVTR